MAIFSLNIAKVSKSNGKSAVNSSAYIHRERWQRDTTGEHVDIAINDEPIYSEMPSSKNAPWNFLIQLWNAVEKIEKLNALPVRRIIVALPGQLSLSQNQKNFYTTTAWNSL